MALAAKLAVAELPGAWQRLHTRSGRLPLDEGAEDEVRRRRTLSDESLAGQVVLGLYWLPVGDGWYVDDLALTFIPDEDN